MSRIYYQQASDVYCMISHAMLLGLHQLGHEVQSNIQNYDFIKPVGKYDLRIISTSGNDRAIYPDWEEFDAFIDGRDQEDVQVEFQYSNKPYFKSNGLFGLKLPCCMLPERYTSPDTPRSQELIYLAGHSDFGREHLAEFLKPELIDGDNRPLVARYPAMSCNMYSVKYYDALSDSRIGVNAPGGSANTKKSQELMASGCLVLNFIPPTFHQETPNFKSLIPKELDFPDYAVLDFHNKAEFDEIMADPPYELAWETYKWSKSWNPEAMATYVLTKIAESKK